MKKKLISLGIILCALCCADLSACTFNSYTINYDPTTLVISVGSAGSYEGESFLSYMAFLQKGDKLTFTYAEGEVTSINDVANTDSSMWLLYTSDEDNSDSSKGQLAYRGNTYNMSTLGVSEVIVRNNTTYAFGYVNVFSD